MNYSNTSTRIKPPTIKTTPLTEIEESDRLTPQHYMAVRTDGLTFMQCLEETIKCPELVREVDRLYGTSILRNQAPITKMIDEATGKKDEDMQTFMRFVWNCVFIRCPATIAAP